MKLSESSKNVLIRIADDGGSIEQKGNMRSGKAFVDRGLVKYSKGRLVLTSAGRKFIEKL